MTQTMEDKDRFTFLLVEPDDDVAREMIAVLRRLDLKVDHVRGHLKAVALTEDIAYDCLLVSSLGVDISGLELCAMVRARESRRSLTPAYIILSGPQADMIPIFSSQNEVDDVIAAPCLDLELEWRMRRALRAMSLCRKYGASRLLDRETGLLTPDGLRIYLGEEVNRIGRREGWVSLSVLSVPGLADLRLNYGDGWMEWFKNGIWASLRRQLRNYDRLASMDNGFLCLVSPDLDEEGTRSMLARLGAAIGEYQFQDDVPAARMALAARYLCVRVLGDYRQFDRTSDVLWNWVCERMNEPAPEGVMGHTGAVDLELRCTTAP
ncbi:response regulator transcription factor [Desulfomicrobium salsuginis]